MLLALPLLAAATLGLGGAGVVAGAVDWSGRLPHRIARLWGRAVLAILGVRIVVSGIENVPAGPAVYPANHSSVLDIPLLFAALPVDFRVIHKRSLSLLPLIGWYLFLAGHVSIDRGNPFHARRSLQAAALRIRGGTSVAAFPEGTRSPDERLGPFKRGSFLLALYAGVPVVPVSLAGVKRVIPRGILTLRPGVVRLRVHAPLLTARRAVSEARTLAAEARRAVSSGLDG